MDASATPLPRMNELAQPVGPAVSGWSVRPVPQHTVMAGRFCRLEPLDSARHGPALFEAYSLDREGRNWTYLYNGPFETMAALQDWLSWAARQADPLFFAIIASTLYGPPPDVAR